MPRISITSEQSRKPRHSSRSIVIPPDDVLLDRKFQRRVAVLLASLNIPRRRIADWIADTIYGFGGKIEDSDGDRFGLYPDDVDEAFDNEGSFRWISDFVKLADRPSRQSPQRRVLARIRLIVLCLIICGLLESWGEEEKDAPESPVEMFNVYRSRRARAAYMAELARDIAAFDALLTARPIWARVHSSVMAKIEDRL
jgi:hypothetical protein